MCTGVVHLDRIGGAALLAFVRDEDRTRPTLPPGRWWPEAPERIGGRDERAGGTWLAVEDGPHPRIAFVQNRRDLEPGGGIAGDQRISRGTLPGHVLDHGGLRLDEGDLRRVEPFVLVLIDPSAASRWWNWNGTELSTGELADGWHLVTSYGIDQPQLSSRHRRWLPQFERAPLPDPLAHGAEASTHEAWGSWIELLDGRDAQRGDESTLVIVGIDEHPHFGTVGASLVAVRAGVVRMDSNAAHDVDPSSWRRVDPQAVVKVPASG
jgi:hypothetical protein